MDNHNEYDSLAEVEVFEYGFKLGARMMLEMLQRIIHTLYAEVKSKPHIEDLICSFFPIGTSANCGSAYWFRAKSSLRGSATSPTNRPCADSPAKGMQMPAGLPNPRCCAFVG